MSKFSNSKRDSFLNSIPQVSLDSDANDTTKRCKFNFSFFDVQAGVSQDFDDWAKDELVKLLEKLKHYSKDSLDFWQSQKVGRYSVFVVYESFPVDSDFTRPKHIPHQAQWARFHLENKVRLIGFVIPKSYNGKIHQTTSYRFDTNTFYVVYLDKDHRFYKVKK
jgi:hypothetical protein